MNELIIPPFGCPPDDCGGPCQPPPPGPPPWFPPPQGQPPWYPGANGGVSFGSQAPPNPIRGAFWWNGQALFLFDGAVWVDVGVEGAASGGGTATGTQPPTNPVNGSLWFNGSTLYIWDGNAWVPTSATKTYVQPTAPPAPNPGDQWFDGAQTRIWSGTAWVLVGPGATVGPVPTTTIAMSLNQTQNLTIPPSTGSSFTETPWAAVPNIDTMSGWNATTKQWTPTKAGLYMVMIFGFAASANIAYSQAVLKNDQGVFNWSVPVQVVCLYDLVGGGNSVASLFSAVGMVQMNGTTDFLRHWSYSASGTVYQPIVASPTWQIVAMP